MFLVAVDDEIPIGNSLSVAGGSRIAAALEWGAEATVTIEEEEDSDIIDLENVSAVEISPAAPTPVMGTGLPTVITSIRDNGEGGDST
jgi:hypothetical protein